MKLAPTQFNEAFAMLLLVFVAIVPAGCASLMGVHLATGALIITAPGYAFVTLALSIVSHIKQKNASIYAPFGDSE